MYYYIIHNDNVLLLVCIIIIIIIIIHTVGVKGNSDGTRADPLSMGRMTSC